jgi:hypothetical protein
VLEGIRKKSPKRQLRALPVTLQKLRHLSESSANSWKLNKVIYFYHGFWLVARSEAFLFCYWLGLIVGSVVYGSLSAGDAGGDKLIVPRSAVV